MAVRFDGTSNYIVELDAGSQDDYTFCAWVKISVDRNSWTTALNLNSGGSSDSATFETNSDGTGWEVLFDNDSDQALVQAEVGEWYFLAVTVDSNDVNAYVKPLGGTLSTSAATPSVTASPVNAADFQLGNWPNDDQPLDGCLAGVKLWLGAALTPAELDAESAQLLPVRTANLTAAYPFEVAETTDYSGNGHTLTANGSPFTEPGPTGIPLEPAAGEGVRATATGLNASATATHPITLPTETQTGDVLVVCLTANHAVNEATVGSGAGWTKLGFEDEGSSTNHSSTVFWKTSDGDDALTLTTPIAEESTHVTVAMQAGGTPLLSSNSAGDGTSIDVPTLAVPGGDYRSLVILALDANGYGGQTITPPAGYSNLVASEPASGADSTATFALLANNLASGTSIDPGVIGYTDAEQAISFNIAIPTEVDEPEPPPPGVEFSDASPAIVVSDDPVWTLTTAAFTAPAGSILLAATFRDGPTGSYPAVTSSGDGLSWSRLGVVTQGAGVDGWINASVAVHMAIVATERAGLTVTTAYSEVSDSSNQMALDVRVVTGADTADPVGTSRRGATPNTVNMTTTQTFTQRANSLLYAAIGGGKVSSEPGSIGDDVPTSSDLTVADAFNANSETWGLVGFKELGSVATAATAQATGAAGLPSNFNWIVVEVQAAEEEDGLVVPPGRMLLAYA